MAVLALFVSKIYCMWWQNGVFGGFWPISSNLFMLYSQLFYMNTIYCLLMNKPILNSEINFPPFWTLFGPPQRSWDLWFSFRVYVCPSVRPFVRSAEISKSVHRNILIFDTKLGLPNATGVTFSDFA